MQPNTLQRDRRNAKVYQVRQARAIMAHGSSPAEAVANAQEAIDLWISTARKDDDAVPEPKGRRHHFA